jgi:hypothetical protein
MRPNRHIVFGAIFTLVLFLILPRTNLFDYLIIFLSTFMIDLDHYIYYVFKERGLNPLKAYKWHMKNFKKFHTLSFEQKKRIYGGLYIFHGLEFLTLLLFFGIFLYKPLLLVFVGLMFHMFLDWYAELIFNERMIKLFFTLDFLASRKLKFIEDL